MKSVINMVIWTLLFALAGYASWRISNDWKSSGAVRPFAAKRLLKLAVTSWRSRESDNMITWEYSVVEGHRLRLVVYQNLPPDEGCSPYLSQVDESLLVDGKPIKIQINGFTLVELRNPRSAVLSGRRIESLKDLDNKDYEALIYDKLSGHDENAFDIIKKNTP